ncbi:hypothetical protein A3849_20550 [Paenibacillus sp. P46E]|nr:hypothetical protein A3849_20550 [Paenibacillus sp. P46E]
MITAYAIIMPFVTFITFLFIILSRMFFKKNNDISKKKIAYIPLLLAIIGVFQLMIYGEVKSNHFFVYLAVILVSMYILRSDSREIKR